MLKQWFVNFTIFISFIFIYNHLILYIESKNITNIKEKIIKGILGGILGVFLMLFGINVTSNFSLDLRYLAIIYVLNYFGSLAACISSFIIISSIIVLNGISFVSVLNMFGVVILTVFGVSMIKNKKKRKDNLFILNIQGLFIMTVIFKAVEANFNSNLIISQYCIVIILIGTLTYGLMEYLVSSNNALHALKEEASRDYLTGLFNVRTFNKMYAKLLHQYKEKNCNISFIMIDIDFFKQVNDTYGHNAGDEVLIQVSEILRQYSEEKIIISRMGGEEFSIILLDCDKEMCFSFAESIRIKVENTKFALPSGETLKITISLGISSYPEDVKSLNHLITRADVALYKAKNRGRNKVCDINKISENK